MNAQRLSCRLRGEEPETGFRLEEEVREGVMRASRWALGQICYSQVNGEKRRVEEMEMSK